MTVRNSTAKWAALLVVAGLLLPAASAAADEIEKMREMIEVYTLKLADHLKADEEQAALKEIKLTERWIGEAQTQLAKDEEDIAKDYLRRVEVSLETIALIIDRSKAEKVAFERESAAIAMENEANESGVLLQQQQAMEKKLSGEIDELRKNADSKKNNSKGGPK